MRVLFKNANKLEKYEVTFDEEELIKFREKVINKCSLIVHRDYIGSYLNWLSHEVSLKYRKCVNNQSRIS